MTVKNAALLTAILKKYIEKKQLSAEEYEAATSADLMDIARIHAVQGIVVYMMYEYSAHTAGEEAAEIAYITGDFCNKTSARSEERVRLYRELTKLLSENGIDFIPFKGILIREYYPDPAFRSFGDIDIIIRKDDRKRCHKLMLEHGYLAETDFGEVYAYEKGVEYYEIHTDIMLVNITKNADYKGYFQNMWEYAEKLSDHEYRFKAEFHFVYLISHIAKHVYARGAGVRMYLDIALIMRALPTDFDWNFVMAELEKLKLDRFFSVMCEAIRGWFGVTCGCGYEAPDNATVEDFMRFTMAGGVFGGSGVSAAHAHMRKTDTSETGRLFKLKSALRLLFPTAETLESRYTYLKKSRLLLPIAWVHRPLINLKKLKKELTRTRNILSADGDISGLREFYENIGL